jgi:16S rRNA (cytosine1402-N4)-methyltransferase
MLHNGKQTPFTDEISHHLPVMVDQVIEHLLYIKTKGKSTQTTFIDGTVGGGGHALALLEHLGENDRLFCFDRDPHALQRAQNRLGGDERAVFIHASYSEVEDHFAPGSVGGVLLDLGLSSDQLSSDRGFAFSQESQLDMRFDPHSDISAYDLVNRYSIERMREVFFKFGEEPLSPRIARKIAEERMKGAIRTTTHLVEIIGSAVPTRFETKAVARIFQAIRIEVNNEIGLLEDGLQAAWNVLEPGGVLCVISYHSIEDRRMKRLIAEKAKGCTCPPKLPICACGKIPEAKKLTSSALRPTAVEMRTNNRARSARLRAAVKI